jgi:hypothetical protein
MRVIAWLFILMGATPQWVAGQNSDEAGTAAAIRALEHEWVVGTVAPRQSCLGSDFRQRIGVGGILPARNEGGLPVKNKAGGPTTESDRDGTDDFPRVWEHCYRGRDLP